jgi:hypothetical protein
VDSIGPKRAFRVKTRTQNMTILFYQVHKRKKVRKRKETFYPKHFAQVSKRGEGRAKSLRQSKAHLHKSNLL